MTIRRTLAWSAMGASTLGLLGCAVFREGHARQDRGYVDSQPQYVQQSSQYSEPQPTYVIVQQAPPPLIEERRPAPPSRAYVWIGGFWNWDSQRYSWQGGHYAVPPRADAVWVAPRYDKDPHGYRYSPGQWKQQKQAKTSEHDQGRAAGRDRNEDSAQRRDEHR